MERGGWKSKLAERGLSGESQRREEKQNSEEGKNGRNKRE